MKELLKIIILLFIINNTLSGQYTPLVEEGKFWIYKQYLGTDYPEAISGYAITFLGDTVINSINYKKVYQLDLKGGHDCPPYEMPCWDFDYPYETNSKFLSSFIREDTLNKKIYHLPYSSNEFCDINEYVLFDFSLNVGDTLNRCAYESIWANATQSHPGGIVDSIKTIDVFDKMRNAFFTYGYYTIIGLPYETEMAIAEGVGFKDFGIFYRPQLQFEDFCEGGIEQCNLILSDDAIQANEQVKIYPNPSQGLFYISINPEDLKSITTYSLQGQLKETFKINNTIDLSHLENGLYLLVLTMKNDQIITRMLIKEN